MAQDEPVGSNPPERPEPADTARHPTRVIVGAAIVGLLLATIAGTRLLHRDSPTSSAPPSATSLTSTAPPASATPTRAPDALDAWPLWLTVPAGKVDLSNAPRRAVSRALVMVRAMDPADTTGNGEALFALDSADSTWVRVDLPAGVPAIDQGVALSADGRSIAYTGPAAVTVVDLPTGHTRALTIPPAATTGCRAVSASFSPDGLRLAVMSECGTELSATDAKRMTSVAEVTLSTGDVRQVTTTAGTYAHPQASIAYSPDGSRLALDLVNIGNDNAGAVVVMGADGTERARWAGNFALAAAAPWRDDTSLLGSGLDRAGSVTFLWLAPQTGGQSPALVDPAATPVGFSHGMLVSRAGTTSAATLSVTDTALGRTATWLTLPGTSVVGVLLPTAR